MRNLRPWRQVVSQGILALVALFVLVPIWAVAYLAFDGGVVGWPTTFRLWPKAFTLEIFAQMWANPAQGIAYLVALRNSLIVSAGAMALSVALGASMAYAFARFRFPGRQTGLFTLLVGTLLPPVALMTPLYILLSALGLRANVLLSMTIVYTSFSMPFCIWNMRAAFQAVPKEVEESAFLDGANHWISFWCIMLPLALPAIGVAALVAFLLSYSEFAMGWLLILKPDTLTLAMAMASNFSTTLRSWSRLAALSIMMSAPVVVVFVVLQRYLLNSLLIGRPDD
jgi:arabinogalactan oligomer/maltooligosaccharide transport system permease protein